MAGCEQCRRSRAEIANEARLGRSARREYEGGRAVRGSDWRNQGLHRARPRRCRAAPKNRARWCTPSIVRGIRLRVALVRPMQVDDLFEVVVLLVVDDIGTQAKQAATLYEVSLDIFSSNFETLVGQYQREYDRYRLDEIVVAAIAPVVRHLDPRWRRDN